MTISPTISAEELTAIVNGYHGNPFAVLGPHPYEENAVVRAFLPHAAQVQVLLDGEPADMQRVHPNGFYEVILPGRTLPLDYRLRVTTHDGMTYEADDPYSFPPLLTDFDEYLLAQGTHLHVYERMGAHLAEVNGRTGVRFAVWAPSALRVSVVGNFNNWDGRR
ncbi:MAG: hypothetical protein KC415_00860, partial [Anaerolineales bacterium]|nr:hypothetical protein [Anaerolineales bacterium]